MRTLLCPECLTIQLGSPRRSPGRRSKATLSMAKLMLIDGRILTWTEVDLTGSDLRLADLSISCVTSLHLYCFVPAPKCRPAGTLVHLS